MQRVIKLLDHLTAPGRILKRETDSTQMCLPSSAGAEGQRTSDRERGLHL